MSPGHLRITLAAVFITAGFVTWATWDSRLPHSVEAVSALGTAVALGTSILAVVIGVSLASGRSPSIEAARARRVKTVAFFLLGIGLAAVALAVVGPVYPAAAGIAFGLSAALGVGTFAILLGLARLQ